MCVIIADEGTVHAAVPSADTGSAAESADTRITVDNRTPLSRLAQSRVFRADSASASSYADFSPFSARIEGLAASISAAGRASVPASSRVLTSAGGSDAVETALPNDVSDASDLCASLKSPSAPSVALSFSISAAGGNEADETALPSDANDAADVRRRIAEAPPFDEAARARCVGRPAASNAGRRLPFCSADGGHLRRVPRKGVVGVRDAVRGVVGLPYGRALGGCGGRGGAGDRGNWGYGSNGREGVVGDGGAGMDGGVDGVEGVYWLAMVGVGEADCGGDRDAGWCYCVVLLVQC